MKLVVSINSAFDAVRAPMAMPVNVRPAISEDIPQLVRLERLSPTAAHWSEEQYRRAVEPLDKMQDRIALVAEADDLLTPGSKFKTPALSRQKARRQGRGTPELRSTLIGFLVARRVECEWELENIVVATEFRGQGLGTQLLEALLARVRHTNDSAVFLEVRESNAAARRLYENAGFQETGRRKLYYSHPGEDAVLYCKNVV